MIVPTNRFISWVAIVGLPFSVLGIVSPAGLVLAVIAITGLAIIAAIDILLSWGYLDGISVELPAIVRMTKDREGLIEVNLGNEGKDRKSIRLALSLPTAIDSPKEDMIFAMPGGAEWSRIFWPCTPSRRGLYSIDQCAVERISPLGFWSIRSVLRINSEIRVYPNLFRDRKYLAALFLNRGTFGIRLHRQVGKGREFEKLRDYIPGDSFEDIHWKATAKRGKPITKEYQIERTQEVYVIIDASRLSAQIAETALDVPHGHDPESDSARDNMLERYITAALILCLVAERQGDKFGILTFGDKIFRFVRANSGKDHYGICRDVLYTLNPHIVTPDFDEVSTFIRLQIRRRSLLIFLTSLDDPILAESFTRNIQLISRHHLILVNMLHPRRAYPLFTDQNIASVDEIYERLGGHIQWYKLQELAKVFQRQGIQFNLLENEKLSLQLVNQYFSVKQRQLL